MSLTDDAIHYGIFKSNFAFWMDSNYIPPQLISFLGVNPEVQTKLTQEDKSWLSEILISPMYPISQRQPGTFKIGLTLFRSIID